MFNSCVTVAMTPRLIARSEGAGVAMWPYLRQGQMSAHGAVCVGREELGFLRLFFL